MEDFQTVRRSPRFSCWFLTAWRESEQSFGEFVTIAARSIAGITLVRYPNRFRRVPPPNPVTRETGWNRELLDGDNSPARNFFGVFAFAVSWVRRLPQSGWNETSRAEAGAPNRIFARGVTPLSSVRGRQLPMCTRLLNSGASSGTSIYSPERKADGLRRVVQHRLPSVRPAESMSRMQTGCWVRK